MTSATRCKNYNWTVHKNSDGRFSYEAASLAVLMDIRDELRTIHTLLGCHRIPKALDAVVAMHKQGVKRRVARKRARS